jgi:hypothetical protein
MLAEQYLVVALAAILAAFLVRRLAMTSRAWRFHGDMLVICPENRQPAEVNVNMLRAAVGELVGRPHLELNDCSRWPERAGCEQDCLWQIERNPKEHRVWNIAAKWFEGKKCALCRKPIEPVSHMDHPPALMKMVDRKTVEWRNVPVERLPAAFAESVPVCWSCHMTETFLRKFPGCAVIRPFGRDI